MSETTARCLTCGKHVVVSTRPIPYLFTCLSCGPLPERDPPQSGRCKAGHWAAAVYPTRFGSLCFRHLAETVRIAIWKP